MIYWLLLLLSGLLSGSLSIASVSALSLFSSSIQTTARKNLGKKSFLLKQERGELAPVLTPAELQTMVQQNAQKTPGSKYHRKSWINWRGLAIEALRAELARRLPHPADRPGFEALFFQLGVAADRGVMPSFAQPGVRAAYGLEFVCRARQLANVLVDVLHPQYDFAPQWKAALRQTPLLPPELGTATTSTTTNDEPFRVLSVGGGPGFDYVGVALAATMSAPYHEENRPIHATIMDYEEGWQDMVEAMDQATQTVLQQPQFSCEWGGKCDITQPLLSSSNNNNDNNNDNATNAACLRHIQQADLIICQYCVAENAQRLQETDYVFFEQMMQHAKDGTLFILTETAPRLWPAFCHVFAQCCSEESRVQVTFNQNGKQMFVLKSAVQNNDMDDSDDDSDSIFMTPQDAEMVQRFAEIAECHKRKINAGYKRQTQKRRYIAR